MATSRTSAQAHEGPRLAVFPTAQGFNVNDPDAHDPITKSEQKLLKRLKQTDVLPQHADLTELVQWGFSNNLFTRLELRQEANKPVAEFDANQGLLKSERRLLNHLKSLNALPPSAGVAELRDWGRSNGMRSRDDLRRAGNEILKSGVTLEHQAKRAQVALRTVKEGRVEKGAGTKASQGDTRRMDGRVKQLNECGQRASNAPGQLLQQVYHADQVNRANEIMHAPLSYPSERECTAIPGLAERCAERAERRSTTTEPSMGMHQNVDQQHRLGPAVGIKNAGGSASPVAAPSADTKKFCRQMHQELNALKARSLISPNATVEDLPAWKQANVATNEDWESTLRRLVAHAEGVVGDSPPKDSRATGAMRTLSPEDFESGKQQDQFEWIKRQGLLPQHASIEDMLRWRETHARAGETFSQLATRMLSLGMVPTQKQHGRLHWLKRNRLLDKKATVEDMLRWGEANAQEGETLKAVIKRMVAENPVKQAEDFEALAQAEQDHASGVLEDEWRDSDHIEMDSEDDDVQFVLER